jgi:hypothetical protein
VPHTKSNGFSIANNSAAIVLDSAVSSVDSAGPVSKMFKIKKDTANLMLEVPPLKCYSFITGNDSAG